MGLSKHAIHTFCQRLIQFVKLRTSNSIFQSSYPLPYNILWHGTPHCVCHLRNLRLSFSRIISNKTDTAVIASSSYLYSHLSSPDTHIRSCLTGIKYTSFRTFSFSSMFIVIVAMPLVALHDDSASSVLSEEVTELYLPTTIATSPGFT